MAGVCVRHTDDCTPHCATSKKTGKTVCSKGCNNVVHVASSGDEGQEQALELRETAEEGSGDTSGIALCQAEKIVECPTGKPCTNNCGHDVDADIALFHQHGGNVKKTCVMQKKVACKGSCSSLSPAAFAKLHAIGSTCIITILEHTACFKQLADSVITAACADVVSRCGMASHTALEQAAAIVEEDCDLGRCNVNHCESLALTY